MADELRNERTAKKIKVNRARNHVDECIMSGRSSDRAVEELKAAFSEFAAAHDKVMSTVTTEAGLKECEEYYATVSDGVNLMLQASRAKEDKMSDAAGAYTSQGLTRGDLEAIINLPRLTIESYDGDPLKYHSFMAVFDAMVGKIPGDSEGKLCRLLQYTTGRAKDAIGKCSLIGGDDGYKRAREILEARFGNKHIIRQRVVHDILNGPPVRTPEELQSFADELEHAFEILKKMEHLTDLDSHHTIIEVMARLDCKLQEEWIEKAIEIKEKEEAYPNLQAFVKFVMRMATFKNDPLYGDNALASQVKAAKVQTYHANTVTQGETNPCQRWTGNMAPSTTAARQYPPRDIPKRWIEPRCVLCKERHRLWSCSLFKQKSIRERIEVVNRHKLCHNCLLSNHPVEKCRKNSVCSVPNCGKKHTKFIHQPEVTPRADAKSRVTNASVSKGPDVCMPVVPVTVNGARTFALLDTASTQSFVTQHLVDKLGVTGEEVKYELSTIDNEREEKVTETVGIEVSGEQGQGEKLVMQDVYVTNTIPVSVPKVEVKRYDHLKGIPIPDTPPARVDLLLGQDHAEVLIPLEVRKGRPGEPFAVRTVLGWALNGPVVEVKRGEGDEGKKRGN